MESVDRPLVFCLWTTTHALVAQLEVANQLTLVSLPDGTIERLGD